jgi:hypothetical protein
MKIAPLAVRRCSSSTSDSTFGAADGAIGVGHGRPRARGRWLLPLAAAVLLLGACDDDLDPVRGDAGDAGSDGSTDGPVTAARTCSWNPSAPELVLPKSQVKGVLSGPSRNASSTCTRQKGAGGPEAIYVLRVTERTVVELETVSGLDTVIAIRRACEDPLTEIACNDIGIQVDDPAPGGVVDAGFGGFGGAAGAGPPIFTPDAGQPVPVTDGRDGHLRTALDPGTYFVVIDEAEPFGVGGEFTLKVSSSTPPAQSSCVAALPVMDGTSLAAEQLDLSAQKDFACSGGVAMPALFYAATIPSGQRITVRAHPTRGDRGWLPSIQLFSACADGMCLGMDSTAPDGDRVLRYVNNGNAAQPVYFSVSSSSPVGGAVFRLDVAIAEPIVNATCQAARPISDGQILRNQDLSEGQISNDFFCKQGGGPSLYYSAKLLAHQTISLNVAGHDTNFGRSPLLIVVREGCGPQNTCQVMSEPFVSYRNDTASTKNVVIEVSTFGGIPPVFDLTVSLPLPAGGVTVSPTQGLVTTEAGGEATFDVVLTSPPLMPTTIALSSSEPDEGTVKPASLIFNGDDWDKPKRVTVVGVNDTVKDGDKPYTIVVQPSTSLDPRYQGLDGADVQVINRDDEPGFRVVTSGALVTSESGAKATFTVVLQRAPTATVHLPLSSGDLGEATVSPADLVFEPAAWNQPQTVTLTGVDDTDRDGPQSFKVILGVSTSADAGYAGIDPADLDARNADNDFQAVAAQPISGDRSCAFGGFGQRIGVDDVGTIYAALTCDGGNVFPGFDGGAGTGGANGGGGAGGFAGGSAGMSGGDFDAGVAEPIPFPRDAAFPADVGFGPQGFIAVSSDGGHTFGPPMPVGAAGFETQVVGYGNGRAAVTVAGAGQGFALVRTENGGASWLPPQMLALNGNNGRLAASGQHLAITAETEVGVTIWTSGDGGRTLKTSRVMANFRVQGVFVDPDGTVYIATFDGALRLQKSVDGGATFDAGISIPIDNGLEAVAMGPKNLYAIPFATNNLVVAARPDGAMLATLGGTDPGQGVERLLIPGPTGGVALVDRAPDAQIRWLSAGATALPAPRSAGFVEAVPSGVALSDTAAVLIFQRNGRIWSSVEIAP